MFENMRRYYIAVFIVDVCLKNGVETQVLYSIGTRKKDATLLPCSLFKGICKRVEMVVDVEHQCDAWNEAEFIADRLAYRENIPFGVVRHRRDRFAATHMEGAMFV